MQCSLFARRAIAHASAATRSQPPPHSSWQLLQQHQQQQRHQHQQQQRRQLAVVVAAAAGPTSSSSKLAEKRCEPCEASHDALDSMGLAMVMDADTADKYRQQVDPRWQLVRDAEDRLRIKRRLRTKNFVKALDLFQRVGEVAEQEKHHPDLHLEGWNNVTIELFTHERNGLSENDFIVAAKLDELLATPEVAALLSKKQPEASS